MCWPQCNSISFVRTLQCKNFPSRFAHFCHQSVHVCNKLLLSVFDSRMKGCGMCEAKTWLRNKMREDRLNGLMLMHMNKNVKIDVSEVIDMHAKSSKHRLEFLL